MLFSFYANQAGVVFPFVLLSASPVSGANPTVVDLSSATIIWVGSDGAQRPLEIVSALSGAAQYITSAGDFQFPVVLQGQLRVSGPTGTRFYSQTFAVHAVRPIEQRL